MRDHNTPSTQTASSSHFLVSKVSIQNVETLQWIRKDIVELLQDANIQLDSYQTSGDAKYLKSFFHLTEEVSSILELFSAHSASKMFEELLATITYLKDSSNVNMQAIVDIAKATLAHLPVYLDEIIKYEYDLSDLILPNINRIRALRRVGSLQRSQIYTHEIVEKGTIAEVSARTKFHEKIGSQKIDPQKRDYVLRQHFLRWLQDPQNKENVYKLVYIFQLLRDQSQNHHVKFYFWLFEVIFEAVYLDCLLVDQDFLKFSGRVLRSTTKIIQAESNPSSELALRDLVSELLFFISIAKPKTDSIITLQKKFNLTNEHPTKGQLMRAQQNIHANLDPRQQKKEPREDFLEQIESLLNSLDAVKIYADKDTHALPEEKLFNFFLSLNAVNQGMTEQKGLEDELGHQLKKISEEILEKEKNADCLDFSQLGFLTSLLLSLRKELRREREDSQMPSSFADRTDTPHEEEADDSVKQLAERIDAKLHTAEALFAQHLYKEDKDSLKKLENIFYSICSLCKFAPFSDLIPTFTSLKSASRYFFETTKPLQQISIELYSELIVLTQLVCNSHKNFSKEDLDRMINESLAKAKFLTESLQENYEHAPAEGAKERTEEIHSAMLTDNHQDMVDIVNEFIIEAKQIIDFLRSIIKDEKFLLDSDGLLNEEHRNCICRELETLIGGGAVFAGNPLTEFAKLLLAIFSHPQSSVGFNLGFSKECVEYFIDAAPLMLQSLTQKNIDLSEVESRMQKMKKYLLDSSDKMGHRHQPTSHYDSSYYVSSMWKLSKAGEKGASQVKPESSATKSTLTLFEKTIEDLDQLDESHISDDLPTASESASESASEVGGKAVNEAGGMQGIFDEIVDLITEIDGSYRCFDPQNLCRQLNNITQHSPTSVMEYGFVSIIERIYRVCYVVSQSNALIDFLNSDRLECILNLIWLRMKADPSLEGAGLESFACEAEAIYTKFNSPDPGAEPEPEDSASDLEATTVTGSLEPEDASKSDLEATTVTGSLEPEDTSKSDLESTMSELESTTVTGNLEPEDASKSELESSMSELEATTVTGNLEPEDASKSDLESTMSELESTTVTGNLEPEDASMSELESTTVTGSLEPEDASKSDLESTMSELESTTVTGNLEPEDASMSELESTTVTGNLEPEDASKSELESTMSELESTTVTGNLEPEDATMSELESTTVTGNLEPEDATMSELESTTVTGNLEPEDASKSDLESTMSELEATTVTGNLEPEDASDQERLLENGSSAAEEKAGLANVEAGEDLATREKFESTEGIYADQATLSPKNPKKEDVVQGLRSDIERIESLTERLFFKSGTRSSVLPSTPTRKSARTLDPDDGAGEQASGESAPSGQDSSLHEDATSGRKDSPDAEIIEDIEEGLQDSFDGVDTLVDPEIYTTFIEENQLITQAIRKELSAIANSDVDSITEEIQELSRNLHTTKGNLAIIGFNKLSSLIHNCESLLQSLSHAKIQRFAIYYLIDFMDWYAENSERAFLGEFNDKITMFIQRLAEVSEKLHSEPEPKPEPKSEIDVDETPPESFTAGSERKSDEQSDYSQSDGGTQELNLDVGTNIRSINREIRVIKENLSEFHSLSFMAGKLIEKTEESISQISNISAIVQKLANPSNEASNSGDFNKIAERIRELKFHLQAYRREFHEYLNSYDRNVAHLRTSVLHLTKVQFGTFENLFRMTLNRACKLVNRKARLVIVGKDIVLDKTIVDALKPAIDHLIRNSISHGIEPQEERVRLGKPEYGIVQITCLIEEGSCRIIVEDDGRGIQAQAIAKKSGLDIKTLLEREDHNEALLNLICAHGVTTVDQVSSVAGRGVGMDVVHQVSRTIGARLTLKNTEGKGCQFQFEIPNAAATVNVAKLAVGDELFGINSEYIKSVESIHDESIQDSSNSMPIFNFKGNDYHLLNLNTIFLETDQLKGKKSEEKNRSLVLISSPKAQNIALIADSLQGFSELLSVNMTPQLASLAIYRQACLLPTGEPLLVLNMDKLLEVVTKP